MRRDFIDIQKILESGTDYHISNMIKILEPYDIAEIYNNYDEEFSARITKCLDVEGLAKTLPHFSKNNLEDILAHFNSEQIQEALDMLETDDATDVLENLPVNIKDAFLEKLEKKKQIQALLEYPSDSAGGIMQSEFFKVRMGMKVQDVIRMFHRNKNKIKDIFKIYAVDEEDILCGTIDFQDLVLSNDEDSIDSLVKESVYVSHVNEDQEDIAKAFVQYDLLTIPVVDDHNRMIGRITYDDIHDVLEDEASEDMMIMAGVSADELEPDASKLKLAFARLPWLGVSMLSSFATGYVLLHFDKLKTDAILAASLVPLVMTMTGNIGTQSAMITTRELSLRENRSSFFRQMFFKECSIGVLVGVLVCLFSSITVYLLHGNLHLSITLCISLISSILTATLVGTLFPIIFDHFDIDPAVAAGPLVTSGCDLIGVLIYLLVTLSLL